MRIQPKGINEDVDDVSSNDGADLPMYASHHDDISNALHVEVKHEEEDYDFYILKCSSEKQLTSTSERDAWHNHIN